ncbi:putative ubiquitin-conjugating enzyme E2 26 [Hordeum vulgare]|nr:putative ubiquitin-conjugating enzyme E2 26 [Hordeum vulgare]
MGLFSGAGNNKAKGKSPAIPFSSEFLPPPPAPARRPRQRVNVPVHQVVWHWQHCVPLPYPDATLPHDWHLDPERIPVPAAPWSARAHAKEMQRWRALLTSEQRRDLAYATDSPNWARWFAFEHEEARRRGVCEVDRTLPPPPLIVREEDQAAEAAYQASLTVVYRERKEDERRRAAATKQEEATYEAAMARAMALSAAGCDSFAMVDTTNDLKALHVSGLTCRNLINIYDHYKVWGNTNNKQNSLVYLASTIINPYYMKMKDESMKEKNSWHSS